MKALCSTPLGREKVKAVAAHFGLPRGRTWDDIPDADLALLHRHCCYEVMTAEALEANCERLGL